MPKINLTDLSNLQNEVTATAAINNNNTLIEAAIDNSISRDGTQPNQMNANLDMNSNRIINLPDALDDQEPVTLSQFNASIGALESGAVLDAPFILTEHNEAFASDRVLSAGSGLEVIDGGAKGNISIGLSSAELNALSGTGSSADKLPYYDGIGSAAITDFTPFARTVLDDADATSARATLGAVIGTDVQAQNARLADIAGITYSRGDILYHNGTNLARLPAGTSGQHLETQGVGADPVWADETTSGGDMLAANNLSDLANVTTARTNLDMAAFGPSGVYLGSSYDLNSISKNGFYGVHTPVNGPDAVDFFYITHQNLSGPPENSVQRAVSHSTGATYTRHCIVGTWSAWEQLGRASVATRTALKALATTPGTAYLTESGREGLFVWKTGNYSTHVTNDPSEGVYIKADAVAATSGAWVRSFDGPLVVTWFGAIADDSTQCQPAFQAALNLSMYVLQGRAVYAPAGVYRFNAGLVVDAVTTLYGDVVSAYKAYATTGTRGGGTWLHQTHTTSSLITIQRPVGGRCTGTTFHSFGVFQDHAAPGVGWVPTVYPYVILANSVDDVFCRDLVLLNVYQGILMTGSLALPAGRLRCQRVMGQAFYVGINVDFSADVTVLDDIHLWLFWSDNTYVRDWMRTNGISIVSARNDNAKFSKIFTFGYRYGILLTGNASGITQRLLCNQMGFDDCPRGFWFDTSADSCSAMFSDCYVVANPATTNADLFACDASSASLQFTNLRLSNSQANGVYVSPGALNSDLRFTQCWIDGWNIAAGGYAAYSIAEASSTIRTYNSRNTSGGGAAASGGPGSFTAV